MDQPGQFAEPVPQHTWGDHAWSNAPTRSDRLYQGPFPDSLAPGAWVCMVTHPSTQPLRNFGMGLISYILGDQLPKLKAGESMAQAIEDIARIPMGSQLYIRPTWRQMQSRPGRLDPFEPWEQALEMAEKYGKRLAFRIFLANPDIEEESLPDFVLEKVPQHRLGQGWAYEDGVGVGEIRARREHFVPHYHHPYFRQALDEFDALLAERYNGDPRIEFMDTYMYGFWGEGHSWPFESSPFPDPYTAQDTWVEIFEMQRRHWDRTPLVTNTQPDLQRVGNAEVLEQTVRTGNWIRSDTIFIEPQQIEALSNRPAWIGAVSEVGMSDGKPASLHVDDLGLPLTERIIAHVRDIGAHYWSLWNWHNIHAQHVLNYYRQYPEGIDALNRSIGYRVRPSWVWTYEHAGRTGLIFGMVNDGIAGVPGVLVLSLLDEHGQVLASGSLDAGQSVPHHVRQARLMLPPGQDWKGLRLKVELDVKGVLHPVQMACLESLNPDGSLTLAPSRL
jgi:hypothetical protein